MIMLREKETTGIIKDREEPYRFRGVDVLIKDFYRDVGRIRRGEI